MQTSSRLSDSWSEPNEDCLFLKGKKRKSSIIHPYDFHNQMMNQKVLFCALIKVILKNMAVIGRAL